MKQPWLKFYPADWRSDPRLRMCTLAARGLWMEMLALMHEAEPYGHLLISTNAPTNTQLSVLAGAPSDQIPELLRELEAAGVYSRTSKGVIYSRRMVRDQKKARVAQNNGKTGGSPTLCNQRAIPPSVNPPDNPPLKPQKPEARSQMLDSDSLRESSNVAVADQKAWVFGELLVWLKSHTGRPEHTLRAFLAKCCQQFGDDSVVAAGMMVRAPPVPVEPLSAIMERLTRGANKHVRAKSSAISNLYAGAALALADRDAARAQRPDHRGTDLDLAEPLLDG